MLYILQMVQYSILREFYLNSINNNSNQNLLFSFLMDIYGIIVSVIYKGEYNEIIIETDSRKWLMTSMQDEQVATYAPVCFDFKNAHFTLCDNAGGEEQ